jgi:hypothetical protein
MARQTLDDHFFEIPITSGTVQNTGLAPIEINNAQTDNTGIILEANEIYSWDNETIYARKASNTSELGEVCYVPFKKSGEGGGGGSYTLPVATASKLGGVKSSNTAGKIKVNSDGTMSFNGNPNDGTPIGTIISYMGVSAPAGYLACDGTVYSITDYPGLADHIKTQFGSYDNFGGDGTTTFAVPDLQGEFLRGTGTNSHTNQGSGANVGVHQDGTNINYWYLYSNRAGHLYSSSYDEFSPRNPDKITKTGGGSELRLGGSTSSNSDQIPSQYTTRPTNTSVLYCIKC